MSNQTTRYQPIDPQIQALADRFLDYKGSVMPYSSEAILEMLTELQAQRGCLQPEALSEVARVLHIPASRVYGIATFYSMLSVGASSASPEPAKQRTLRVCDGPVCWLCGAQQTHQAIQEALEGDPASMTAWRVERTSCLGLCDRAPAVLIDEEQAGPLPPDLVTQLKDRIATGQDFHYLLPPATSYNQPRPGEVRVMMEKAGLVDPDSLESALEHSAYQALGKALSLSPEAVLAEVENSGLTGRGGAGFPVGRKWRFVVQAPRTPKYIICNADESEPLIFKDRVLVDTNPHQILEGMAIAGYATGAHEAFIYIRGEYVSQANRLERAIQQAEAAGRLGENIQGSGFSFHIHVHRGAGAYICGEETALIESLEGKRGEPRNRPPYPPSAGYRGMPTLVNNVESYAAVPAILRNGAAWYRGLSDCKTPQTKVCGTKMYMILGHVNQPGLFEAPFGITLRQAIENFGNGMRPGSTFNFALTGGAAGTLVPPELLDIPIDYASVAQGVSLGAGSFLICDQRVSPVAILRELLHFFQIESCGKCTPCREGTLESLHILQRLSENQGKVGDVQRLRILAQVMQVASFCGLGQAVAIPVFSALNHFEDLFLACEKAG